MVSEEDVSTEWAGMVTWIYIKCCLWGPEHYGSAVFFFFLFPWANPEDSHLRQQHGKVQQKQGMAVPLEHPTSDRAAGGGPEWQVKGYVAARG